MFYQIFLSPQVKRCAIINYKHGLFHLPKNLKLKDLRKLKISSSALFHTKTRVSLKYPANDCTPEIIPTCPAHHSKQADAAAAD